VFRERATILHRLRHPELHGSILGRTGLAVTGAGFGGYRISSGIASHAEALRHALLSGINLIDTSANYADGGSEELIGQVIGELIAKGDLQRDELVIVSKGGYMQGANFRRAQERMEAGEGFPEVVEYADGLWHCIAPEFLEDQITRSLERLGLDTIDVYLLHNPEYYLGWAKKTGMPHTVACRDYERRVRRAFEFLESQVDAGRIAWYGISSNTFVCPRSSYDHTSLDMCLRVAWEFSERHHFAVIQFPGNLLEPGFARETNSDDGSTMIALARAHNLGTLVNRPLNAIVNDELIRLAEFPDADAPADERDVERAIASLEEVEAQFQHEVLALQTDDVDERHALSEFVTVGARLREHWREFGTMEIFSHALAGTFSPRLAYVASAIRRSGTAPLQTWFDRYMEQARTALRLVGSRYAAVARERTDDLKGQLSARVGRTLDGSISSIAIRSLLSVSGVSSVLVGMRRVEYVNDVISALTAEPIDATEWWTSERDRA